MDTSRPDGSGRTPRVYVMSRSGCRLADTAMKLGDHRKSGMGQNTAKSLKPSSNGHGGFVSKG